jgi:hypothetical protein
MTDTTRRPMAGWTLRKRLVAGIVAMLAVFSLVVGAVSVLALHQFLLSRVDAQLTSAIGRSRSRRCCRASAPAPSACSRFMALSSRPATSR